MKTDPETEQTQPFAGDPVDREIREAQNLKNLRTAFDQAMWAGWSIDEEE